MLPIKKKMVKKKNHTVIKIDPSLTSHKFCQTYPSDARITTTVNSVYCEGDATNPIRLFSQGKLTVWLVSRRQK